MMKVLVASDPAHLAGIVSAAKALSPDTLEAVSTSRIDVPVDRLRISKLELNDCWVQLLSDLEFDLLMLPATRDFKEIGARVAARKSFPYLSEVLSLNMDGGIIAERFAFSGRGVERLRISLPAVMTISPGELEPSKGQPSSTEEIEFRCEARVSLVERREKRAEVDLSKAKVIVSVGRGLKRKEDLEMIRELASLIGAEIACTRPISADLKWLPEERHVGMTGARVKPKIYLALGISGQIQHVIGFRDAERVISVNIDPDAPIADVSDYFIVADLYEVVPKLIEKLKSSERAD